MKVTKLGHCCLFIEYKDFRILTDPGGFSIESQKKVKDIDIILITHEHGDHLHTESLKEIISNSHQPKIITNSSVAKLLAEIDIVVDVIEDGQSKDLAGLLVEGFGNEHAEIFGDFGAVQNTGYFIDNKLFYPGDAFTNPGKSIDILAVPIAAPWMALREAIRYVKEVRPNHSFPVHDAVLSDAGRGVHFRVFGKNTEDDTHFIPMEAGSVHKFE